MIEFRQVEYEYPGANEPIRALDGVDVSVAPGELLAVLGPNGSGKSTFARLCNGLLRPTAGAVTVDGTDTSDREHVWAVRSRVGLVLQNPDNQIVGTVVEEDVAFGPENLGIPSEEIRQRVDEALAHVGLTGFERREPHLLSEGQKQRLAIAGALAMRPEYLVLDEPSAMLDPSGRAAVLAIIEERRRSGTGVIHITHRLADVATADRVLVLDGGRVVYSGTPAGLLADVALVERVGLTRSSLSVLVESLAAAGIPVPLTSVDAETVVSALWR